MYVAQEVNHTLRNVYEEERDDGIKLTVIRKHL